MNLEGLTISQEYSPVWVRMCNKEDLHSTESLQYLHANARWFVFAFLINRRPKGIYCTGDICLSDLIMVEEVGN